jgi:hypothetical protein
MSLPSNFGSAPGEELHRSMKNACIEFRKLLKATRDIGELQEGMQKIIDTGKQMNWHQKNSGTYHKEEGAKTVEKLFAEFKRYITDLQTKPSRANLQDLSSALDLLEQFVKSYKVA